MRLIRPDQVDWLLSGDPRPAQLEALARSYYGAAWRETKDEPMPADPIRLLGEGPRVGWAHFMEMRVGKTPTLLNEFMLLKRDFDVGRLLVVSPNRYKFGWLKDIEFFVPNAPVHVFESKRSRHALKFVDRTRRGILVINYEALNTVDGFNACYQWLQEPCLMGFDESVKLKNPTARTTSQSHGLSKDAALVRVLTGLPNPQSPADFYSQLRICRNLDGVNFYAFRNKYCEMGGFKGKKIVGLKNAEDLNGLLNRWSFRAKRRDWGTQMDCDFEQVELNMSKPQMDAYAAMERDMIAWISEEEYVSAAQIITRNLKLQQISSGFVIDEDGRVQDLLPFENTPKFLDLRDRLKEEVPGKTLVVCHFVHTVRKLVETLDEFNPAVIGGDSTMKFYERDAESEKARFNGDPRCRVMIAQADAVKYGHTLMGTTEDPCLDVCFFENSYNLDTRAQCEERPQGEGQQAAVHVWDYFSSPLERDIVQALQDKRNVAEVFLDHYKLKENH